MTQQLSSPFGKHPAEVLARKSNTIFTFSAVPDPPNPARHNTPAPAAPSPARHNTPASDQTRPISRMSSFYNGYTTEAEQSGLSELQKLRRLHTDTQTHSSPELRRLHSSPELKRRCPSPELRRRSPVPELRTPDSGLSPSGCRSPGCRSPGCRSTSPAKEPSLRHSPRPGVRSPHSPRSQTGVRSASPQHSYRSAPSEKRQAPSPMRSGSQSDCTDQNCLNLFHQHNIDKSPRRSYADWDKHPNRSPNRTPSPTKEPSSDLDRLSQAIRNMDLLYDKTLGDEGDGDSGRFSEDIRLDEVDGRVCGEVLVEDMVGRETETLVAFGESVNVDMADKFAILNAHNIAPLFPELGDDPVSIARVLEVWEDKGLKDTSDTSVIQFLKMVDGFSKGEDQLMPQILCQNLETVLTSRDETHSDTLRESAVATFKSAITNLQSEKIQQQHDIDALNSVLERKNDEQGTVMHEYEERLETEHKKAGEKLRVQKDSFRQQMLQFEKENEQKAEKLNAQMDAIIKRTDKEIKNLKSEESNLKRIVSDRDEDLRLTKKDLLEAQDECEKYYKLQDDSKLLMEEYQKLHRSMQQKVREQSEEQENTDELRRFWEESVEENKKLKDQLDELHTKFSACKQKLEKAEKSAHNATKKLKKLQEKNQQMQKEDDFLSVDQRQKMRNRISVANYPMFGSKQPDPNLAPTIDTSLEDSLNDEILDTESNMVLDLQEENWKLQEEVDNQNFEIERYAKIITRQRNQLAELQENGEEEEADTRKEGGDDSTAAIDMDTLAGLQDSASKQGEAQSKVEALEEEVRGKAVSLENMREQLAEEREAAKEAEEEREQLLQRCREKELLLEELQTDSRDRQETDSRDRQELSDKDHLLETLQIQLASFKEQVELLQGALDLNSAEIESLESQLEENNTVVLGYEDLLAGKQDLLAGKQDLLTEKQTLLDQCTEEFSLCKEEFEKANTQISQLAEEITRIEHEKSMDAEQHKQKVSELERVLEKIREEESTEHATELAQLQDRSIVSGDLIKRLQGTVDSLTVELEHTQSALDEAESECSELKEQALQSEELKKDMGFKEAVTEQLTTELAELTAKVEDLATVQQENNMLTEQNQQLTQFLEVAKAEIEDKTDILEKTEEKINTETSRFTEEKEHLSDQLAAARNTLLETSEEMERRRATSDKEKRKLAESLNSKEEEIVALKTHIEQVEKDYEELVESLNKETDNRVFELQNQLEETAAISSSLKSQLNDLGQQFIVLTGERDKFLKESNKFRVDTERMGGEQELLIGKIEELKITRDTLEGDIEQQVAEYQDMMKCCANLQQDNQDYVEQLEQVRQEVKQKTSALEEKTSALEKSEKEKEEIVQLFDDKIREKEQALEKSILEKSEIEGKVRETEVELIKTKDTKDSLDNDKRSLEQQLTGAIKSLDDLTERYEIENTFLEERVVDAINEVKEVEAKAEENIHEKLEEQKEKMYTEFKKELEDIKESHETVVTSKVEETSTAIAEFKRKCEKKVKEIKEHYKGELEGKEARICSLTEDVRTANQRREEEVEKLRAAFSQEKVQLLETLGSDKDKMLERIHQISEEKVKQLEETHQKDGALFEEKLYHAHQLSSQLRQELSDARQSLQSNTADIETLREVLETTKASYVSQISDHKLTALKRDNDVARLEGKLLQQKTEIEEKKTEIEEKKTEIEEKKTEIKQIESEIKQKESELQSKSDELEQVSLHHTEKVAALRKEHSSALLTQTSDQEHAMKVLMKEHNAEIGELRAENWALRSDHAEQLEIAELEHQEEAAVLGQCLQEEKAALKEEIGSLLEEKTGLKEEKKDLQFALANSQDRLKEELALKEEATVREREKEAQLLQQLEDSANATFMEMENKAAEITRYQQDMATLTQQLDQVRCQHKDELTESKGKLVALQEDLESKLEQLETSSVDSALLYKLKGRLAVLTAALKTEQAVSKERAKQVQELEAVKEQLTRQLAALSTVQETDKSHLLQQLSQQQCQEEESREELVNYYKSVQGELERRVDAVVAEHSQCHNFKRKLNLLKQQLAVEKTGQNPNRDLEHRLQTVQTQSEALQRQVTNLAAANHKLEASVERLVEENSELVEKVNSTEHQIHLALQDTIRTKSQKVAICRVLDSVVTAVTSAA